MRSHAKNVAYISMMVCVAMLMSYLEALLPYIPIPGFKPGLANLAVTVTYFYLGLPSAITISLIRIFLTSLLFGSPVSLLFSVVGGIFTLSVITVYHLVFRNRIGTIGLCVLCSAFHCIGQSLSASILYGASLLFTYLPWILLLSIPTGVLTGTLTYVIISKLKYNLRKVNT